MLEPLATVEHMLRAAAAALSLLAGVQLGRMRPLRFVTVAGGLFGVAVAGYALVSGPPAAALPGGWREALVIMAVLAPAFFWWFAVALFRDAFDWRPVYGLPPLALLCFYVLRQAWGGAYHSAGALLHQATVVSLMAHVISLAVLDFRNDLVDARRRFRVAVALLIPAVGLVIAGAETWDILFGALPAWLSPLHALMLSALSFLFVLWLTAPKPELFAAPAVMPQPRAHLLTPAELVELERLKSVVADGACFEPDLSLSALAGKVGVPEHRLRRLIGRGLGYRNFAAFLNDHRIAEAKRRLGDPRRAREQIATIAFDLGYASLAPFNRAFRQMSGTTPSEYRTQALSQAIDSEKG